MRMLAIDPGGEKKGAAAAFAVDGHVVAVRRRLHSVPDLGPVDVVVIERPQLDRRSRHSATGLLEVAWYGAMLAGRCVQAWGCQLVERTPTEWKGALPKPVHHARIWDALTPPERVLLGGTAVHGEILASRERGALARWARPGDTYCRGYDHDVLDAVGLALFQMGRS